jgi:hypothetical protein
VGDMPTLDTPGTVPRTKTIEAEPLQAKEAHATQQAAKYAKKPGSYSDMVQLVPFEYGSPIEEKLCKAFRGLLARGIAPRRDFLAKETGLSKEIVDGYLNNATWIRKDDSSPAGIVVFLPLEALK